MINLRAGSYQSSTLNFIILDLFVTMTVTHQSFQLRPFSLPPEGVQTVTGTISRENDAVYLQFQLSGQTATLVIPETVPAPGRADGLWRTTCFETFFRPAGSSSYHEVNISPSGSWNLYHFRNYREGMREDQAAAPVSCGMYADGSEVRVDCVLPLAGLIRREDALEVGISCVLEYRNGSKSYWALSHPGQQPDFHHPAAFMLRL